MRRGSCIWFFLVLWSLSFAQGKNSHAIVLEAAQGKDPGLFVDISPHARVIADSQGIYGVAEVDRLFTEDDQLPTLGERPISVYRGIGRDVKAWWIRCTIQSRLTQDTLLWLYMDGGIVDLYTPRRDGTYTMRRTGAFIPMEHRPRTGAPQRFPVHAFHFEAGTLTTVILRIHSPGINAGSKYLYKFDRHIFPKETFLAFDRVSWFVNSLILGVLFAVSIYHFLIWLFRKRSEYLHFALFVLSFAMVISIFNGFWNEFALVGRQFDYLIVLAALFWTGVYITLYNFTRSYLDLDTHYPKTVLFWRIFLYLRILISILIILFVLFSGGQSNVSFTGFDQVVFTGGLLHTILFLIAVYAGILSLKREKSRAVIFLAAMGVSILQSLLLQLHFQEIIMLPFWATFDIGIMITAFLFAFGIARQLKLLEQKKTEAEIAKLQQEVETEKAVELNAFKTRFFTNITHDFRTPLTVILGMAEQIRQQPTTWTARGLDLIQRNGKKLLRMVDQILQIARLDEGALPVRHIRGDIISFLRKMAAFHTTLADEKGISLRYEPHVPFLLVPYDPEVMEHIVSNILGNAVKFTPGGGTIEIRTDQAEEGEFEIRISDTGPGIPTGMQQAIFDRFVKQDEEGHGIGLAIVRELVHLLDGSVEVESKRGNGATFVLRFPVQESEVPVEGLENELFANEDGPQIAGTHDTIQHGKQIILVVEDNRDLVSYIRTLLEGKFEVHTAQNGSEGLEKAIALIPDIILSDVMMPGMDGNEMCSRVKADIRTSHIPVIMVTAKADLDSKLEGLGMGADAYLTKPFNEKELFLRIEKLIESREKLKQYYRDFHTLDKAHDRKMPESYQSENAFMRKVSEIVHRHLADPDFGVPVLCREIGMSRSQLYRKFSSISPYTIAEFIRKTRLHKAMKLLKSTEKSVTGVSMETGWRNLATFSQNFKNEFGINPSEVSK